MTNVVTISVTERTKVIGHRLEDRERHVNGIHFVEPGKPRSFIVDDDQSLAIDHAPPETPDAPEEVIDGGERAGIAVDASAPAGDAAANAEGGAA